ncbi:MAG: methionyl-tRNA formyltransferase [Endomicrobiales bacterium]
MRVLFFGTAEVSVPFLRELIKNETVVGVVSQPDRPAERGHHVQKTAVKAAAEEAGIPVFQPEKFTPDMMDALAKLEPETGVAVSYGKLIPEKLFTLPKNRTFNVHFSLLPKYRGAAPMQWALINGEKETGVTTFWIEKTLDTGPLLVQKTLPIAPEDDALTLREKLIALGIEALNETLRKIRAGALQGKPQEGEPTCAPSLEKENGRIDWSKRAGEIANLVRGTKPWPGAYTLLDSGKRLKIVKARPATECPGGGAACREVLPGRVTGAVKGQGFGVACGKDFLFVEEVQPESRKAMPAWDFWQGGQLKPGSVLG